MSNQTNKIPYDGHYDGHYNILNNMYSSEKIFIDNLILILQTKFLKYNLDNYELDFILKNKNNIEITQINEYPFSVLEAHLNACIAEEYLNIIKVDNALKYKKPSYKKKIFSQKGGAEGGHIGATLFHDHKLWKNLAEINKLKDFEVTYSDENLPEKLNKYLKNKNYQKGGDVKIDKQLFQSGLKPIDFKNEDGKYNCVKLEEKSIKFEENQSSEICQEGTFTVLPQAPPVQPPTNTTNTTKEIECGPGEKKYNCVNGPKCGNVQPKDCIISLETDVTPKTQAVGSEPNYAKVEIPIPKGVCSEIKESCKKGKFIVDAEYFFYCKLHILNKKTQYKFIKNFYNITTLPLLYKGESNINSTSGFFNKKDLIDLKDLKYPYLVKLIEDEEKRGVNENAKKFITQYYHPDNLVKKINKSNDPKLLELYKKMTDGSDAPKYYYEIGNLRIKENDTEEWAEEIYDYKIGLYTKNHYDLNINESRDKNKVKSKVINQLLLDGISTSFRYGFRLEGLGNKSVVEETIKDTNNGYIYLKKETDTPDTAAETNGNPNNTTTKQRSWFKRVTGRFRTIKQPTLNGGKNNTNNIKPKPQKRTKKHTTSSNVQVGNGYQIKKRLSSNYYQLNEENILQRIQEIYDKLKFNDKLLRTKEYVLPLLHLLHINPFLLDNKSIATFHKLNPDKKENRPLYSLPPILTLYEIINHMKVQGCLESYKGELDKIYECYFNTHKLQDLEQNPICGFIGSSIMISHKPATNTGSNDGKARVRLSDFSHPYFIHKQDHNEQIVEKQIFINFILGLYKFLFYNYLLINIDERKDNSLSTINNNTVYGYPTNKIPHLLESIHEILTTYKNIYPEYQDTIIKIKINNDEAIKKAFRIPKSNVEYIPSSIEAIKGDIPLNINNTTLLKNYSVYSKGDNRDVYAGHRIELDKLIYIQKQNILHTNLSTTSTA